MGSGLYLKQRLKVKGVFADIRDKGIKGPEGRIILNQDKGRFAAIPICGMIIVIRLHLSLIAFKKASRAEV
jgi:hypothetical protein